MTITSAGVGESSEGEGGVIVLLNMRSGLVHQRALALGMGMGMVMGVGGFAPQPEASMGVGSCIL